MKHKMNDNKNNLWSNYFDLSANITVPFPLPSVIVDEYVENTNIPDALEQRLPLLLLRDRVTFPKVALPMDFTTSEEKALLKRVQDDGAYFVAVYTPSHLEGFELTQYLEGRVAVLCQVARVISVEEDLSSALVIGVLRVAISKTTMDGIYPEVTIVPREEKKETRRKEKGISAELALKIAEVKELLIKNLSRRYDRVPNEVFSSIKGCEDTTYVTNFAAVCCALKTPLQQKLLEINTLSERVTEVLSYLYQEQELITMRDEIRSQAREDMDKQQKEYFLQQQIRVMQEELGGGGMELPSDELREKALAKQWPQSVAETFNKELRRLDNLNPHSPDFAVQFQYLETLLELPWGVYSKDNFSLSHAEKVLDKDHFGLDKVKERILEHMAVIRLRQDMKSPILCLWGPPGVGKTSLGKSIADSLGRKYIRISLGGLHDEAEIRGHRRTYIGAMPGRIIQAIKKAGTSNPVIVLDEIDKIDASHKGDPSAALLEVLDPEQNKSFHDNYIDIDYDLSNVMFIATANSLSTISRPLLDRMELIPVSGYITEEKLEIARKHLVPKQSKEHGIDQKDYTLKIPKAVMEIIIESYTRESGVRGLEKQIARIMRKFARRIENSSTYSQTLKPSDLKDFLGVPTYTRDLYQGNDYYGVVTGLAWTSVGGEILFIESSLHKGKDCRLTLTGNLGDVMKESATIALNYIKAHAQDLGIEPEQLAEQDLHLHVPEGAIPKDGPSAGITMLTSFVSAFTKRKVKLGIAMTGEITLRGRVLPVGGIKEKILAAKRSGIKEIILSEENKKDVEEINELYRKGLTFHYVKDVSEVLELALLPKEVLANK
ncbi:endopeptidase La [Porphyromonas gingivicanis]|nr:endopeptidase La [Porphyromonas gingivicanis]